VAIVIGRMRQEGSILAGDAPLDSSRRKVVGHVCERNLGATRVEAGVFSSFFTMFSLWSCSKTRVCGQSMHVLVLEVMDLDNVHTSVHDFANIVNEKYCFKNLALVCVIQILQCVCIFQA